MFKFSRKDLSKYEDKTPPWGPVGLTTYNRTYPRPIYENGEIVRRENWLETCVRVIEGNMNLIPDDPTATKEWALEALELMFHMAWIPPGRGLWMLGTEYSQKRGGDALNNCWYINVEPHSYEDMELFKDTYLFSDPIKPMPSFPFAFAMDRAMLGGGVGFGVPKEKVDKFPRVKTHVNLSVVMKESHSDWGRVNTELNEIMTTDKDEYGFKIKVEDSREGWVIAIRELIDAHFTRKYTGIKLVIDVSDVRGYGEEIKGFGGTSSGPIPLIECLHHINIVLNTRVGNHIRSIDAMDMMNLLGRCVVSGNVRRTALLALGDSGDNEYIDAKNYKIVLPVLELDEHGYAKWETIDGVSRQIRKPYDQCVKKLGKEKTDELMDTAWRQENHRWASNNSVIINDVFEDYHFLSAGISANGEPGIVNLWLSRNYGRIVDGLQELIDSEVDGVNPCGEITMESGENCNLVEFVPFICDKLGISTERAITIATQYAYRITFAHYTWPITREVVERNRRIGVSIGGIQDYFLDKYGHYALKEFENGDITKPVFHQKIVDEIDSWYGLVKKTNIEHARLLKANPSIKVTTVKPSGSISKLPGVSAGVHFHYSPFLIQRIRFHETDLNLKVMELCGYPMEDDLKAPNTKVVEFPIKSPNAGHKDFMSSQTVSIEEQFANQYLFCLMWADNAVSTTITFQQDEVGKIEPLLKAYSDKIKSTSLLPYSGHGYVQAPWEPIDEEEYNRRMADVTMPVEEAYKMINIIEESDILDSECESGICPIK